MKHYREAVLIPQSRMVHGPYSFECKVSRLAMEFTVGFGNTPFEVAVLGARVRIKPEEGPIHKRWVVGIEAKDFEIAFAASKQGEPPWEE